MKMAKFKNEIGNKYGRLTVVEYDGWKDKRTYWLCRCSCGNMISVQAGRLRYSLTKSCGCLHKDLLVSRNYRHGDCKNKNSMYRLWAGMKDRCLRKNCEAYKNYGGRGITVCSRWTLYENFREDMYDMYIQHIKEYGRKNTTINRIDNNGNYELSNCCFATRLEQAQNKRPRKNKARLNYNEYPFDEIKIGDLFLIEVIPQYLKLAQSCICCHVRLYKNRFNKEFKTRKVDIRTLEVLRII